MCIRDSDITGQAPAIRILKKSVKLSDMVRINDNRYGEFTPLLDNAMQAYTDGLGAGAVVYLKMCIRDRTDEEAARKLAEKRKYQSEATVRCYQKMKADAEAGDPEAIRRYEATLAKRRDEYHKKKSRQEELPA